MVDFFKRLLKHSKLSRTFDF